MFINNRLPALAAQLRARELPRQKDRKLRELLGGPFVGPANFGRANQAANRTPGAPIDPPYEFGQSFPNQERQSLR